MSTSQVSTTLRGGRVDEPEMPSGQLVLQPPPQIQPNEGAAGVAMNAIPMLGSLGSIVLVATLGSTGGGSGISSSTRFIAAGMFLFATLGFIFVQIDRQRKQRQQQVSGSRTEYLRYLSTVRKVARDAADQQRRALTWHHPAPTSLPALAEDRTRVWEHSPTDPHFLHVRYGLCAQPLALELVPPESAPIDDVDPAAASALHRLLVVHRLQPDLPASIDLRAFDRVEVCGDEERARSLARSMICSAAAFQSPESVIIAVLATDETLAHWDWVKWLPHVQSLQQSDAVGPMRMVTTSLADLAALLPPDLSDRPRFGADERPATPHILLVTDGAELPPGNHVIPPDGLHGVTLRRPPHPLGRARGLQPAAAAAARTARPTSRAGCRCSRCGCGSSRSGPRATSATRRRPRRSRAGSPRCTPCRPGRSSSRSGEISGPTDFMDLLGLGDVRRFEPGAAWRPRPARDRLRVPIGLGEGGAMVHLDIKESAQQGMGPHGLVIGATGSGKSEFLRTLVLGLTMTHSPEQLNMVLVDFKGGATFAGMSEMPHVSAVITNLAQELTLVDRMQDALSGEMVRRQELLREAGNFASIRDYEKARAAGEDLAPMPSLFIVVDEFSEMLSAKPEFIDLFVAIGRLGRSLGLHLLLASQRLEEGRLRGLESHLSYRIGLRTFSAQESRAVLGVPDAYELPAVPGLGYLKPDPTSMTRFKAAYVSGPPSGRVRVRRDEGGHLQGILPFTISEVQALAAPDLGPEPDPEPEPAESQETLLDIAVDRMVGEGPAAHQVWLPPLDVPDTLDQLMGDLTEDASLGLVSAGLAVPRRPRGPARHGRPAAGAATRHPHRQPQRGRRARGRRRRAAQRQEHDAAHHRHEHVADDHPAGVAVLRARLRRRHVRAAHRAPARRRRRHPLRARGRTPDPGRGVRASSTAARPTSAATASTRSRPTAAGARRAGPTTGTATSSSSSTAGAPCAPTSTTSRWRSSSWRRAASRSACTSSPARRAGRTSGPRCATCSAPAFELRLGDPMDSEIDRKVAALVPSGRPGRGLVQGKLHFLAALPRIDGEPAADTLGDGVEDLIKRVSSAWTGPAGPKLRLLPDRIDLDRIREMAGISADAAPGETEDRRLLLGINEKELAPVGINPDAEPHLLIFGDGQSGKSAVLRTYVHEVMRTRSAKEAQIVVVDYRRSLLGEVPEEYLLNYLTSAAQAQPALKDLAGYLESRIPGPDVSPDQLRNRSWWTGAEVFVVVDDYDLVATQQNSPVALLQPLLAQARDVGLHVVIARRSGGASRALYEPVIQSMRDLAMPGLLLSGSRDEGPLIGNVRPSISQAGRGQLITRDRGREVVQMAWTELTL